MIVYDKRQAYTPIRKRSEKPPFEYLDLWITTKPLKFILTETGEEDEVPAGFEFDKASVPRLAWVWLPRDDAFIVDAAQIHDLFYERKTVAGRPISRKEADQIFHYMLLDAGMRPTKAWAAYTALRAAFWKGWKI